jgi:hypothetical protein
MLDGQSVSAEHRRPDAPCAPNVDWYCWATGSWEDAAEGSVRDARTCTRGQAAAAFSRETTGYLPEVRVWKRYVRPLTRQDVWDGPGKDRWVDRREAGLISKRALAGKPDDPIPSLGELHNEAPDEPPTDWDPDDYDPVWEFVHRSHPDAIPVWICGFKGDTPPVDPPARQGSAHA